jgi:hypothetical protein
MLIFLRVRHRTAMASLFRHFPDCQIAQGHYVFPLGTEHPVAGRGLRVVRVEHDLTQAHENGTVPGRDCMTVRLEDWYCESSTSWLETIRLLQADQWLGLDPIVRKEESP